MATAAIGPMVIAPMAQAQTAPAERSFDIPPQSLADALVAFAAQSGYQVTANGAPLRGVQTRGVKGKLMPTQALSQLLTGTGFTFRISGTLVTLEAVPQTSDGAIQLGPVRVEGEGAGANGAGDRYAGEETATSPVRGFVAHRSATATKTDTPLVETPQSVSVIPRAQSEAQAADSLDQALQYTAGVSAFEGAATRSVATRFVIRGFSTLGTEALYLNGSKFPTNSITGAMEPWNYERIEILKGPASIMYGQATPGGVINLVSKRPTETPMGEIEVQIGSWNRKQVAIDLGGPLTGDGRVRYRLIGLHRDSDSMIEQYPNDKTSLTAALEWKPTEATSLTLLGTYDKTNAGFDSGKPLDGSLLPNPAGKISRDLFVGEPGFDDYDGKGTSLGYIFEHGFSDAWTFRQNLLAYDRDIDWNYASISARVSPTAPRLGGRVAVSRIDHDRGVSLDNQLHGKLAHGRFEHNLLFGLDWRQSRFKRAQRVGTLPSIDLFSPVYGAQPVYLGSGSSEQRVEHLGLYAQDQIKFDGHWIAVIGGRYDFARNSGAPGTPVDKSHAFSPRLALMYVSDIGISPYYSFSRSFQPNSGTDFYLNRFKPTTGTQHEVGIKYEPRGIDASITVAAYEITQQNVMTSDPAHVGQLVQTGEVRSRGFEIEGRAEVSPQFSLITAISVTDAKVMKSNMGNVGTRPASVPKAMASLWADYRPEFAPGFSLGFGVRHVGEQEVNRLVVPSFTTFDAALRYDVEKWQFALNVKNLGDRTYIAACPSTCFYGDERNFVLTARYRW